MFKNGLFKIKDKSAVAKSPIEKWAYRNPVISSILLSIFYYVILIAMVLGNSFNVINNGIIVMILFLFVFLGMTFKQIIDNAQKISKVKKYVIWGIFALLVIAILNKTNMFGMLA